MRDLTWCMLSYRLPREPSRLRLAVWRRLKRVGAVVLHDAVWLLPADSATREAFEWLAQEIEQQGGTAFTWEAQSLDGPQDRAIVHRFRAEADLRYTAIAESAFELSRVAARVRPVSAAQLQQIRRRLVGLERALRLERRRDYFGALGRAHAERTVREALAEADARLATTARPADRSRRQRAVGH
ncbi:MAG: chromate resistance protein [Gemmatimonadales bacterium]|nr:chromate resistance protein [Gemmatimonadales bacterium]MBA3554299.1 chromate resistance protein [Gemmatimonadales bacterium]